MSRSDLQQNILNASITESEVLPIQVDELSAKILSLLVAIHRPVSVLEIGTYFGYSTCAIASNLCGNAQFVSIDLSEASQDLAARSVRMAGLSKRVTLVRSDVFEYLEKHPNQKYDFVFIDGAKSEYWDYLITLVKMIKIGGLLVADDIFLEGDFSAEQGTYQEMYDSIHKYLVFLNKAEFVDTTVIPTKMGMTVSVFT